jgi:hypothetical protein
MYLPILLEKFSSFEKYEAILFYLSDSSLIHLARLFIASPAYLMLVMVINIALLEMLLSRKTIFLYILSSIASMSFLFHSPDTCMRVPIYKIRERAKQQVSYYAK